MLKTARVAGTLLAGTAAAFGASACCAVPLLLAILGLGGAGGALLGGLEAYQPIFLLLMMVFFGLAFWRLYLRPPDCLPGGSCALPAVRRRQRVVFWTALVAATLLVTLPLYAPLLY